MSERQPIAHIIATVRMPVYEGDKLSDNQISNWFEFRQPGITEDGDIGVCKRPVELLHQQYVEVDDSTYEPLRDSLKGLPPTWYPDLLITIVDASYDAGVWQPGGASEFVKKVEARRA